MEGAREALRWRRCNAIRSPPSCSTGSSFAPARVHSPTPPVALSLNFCSAKFTNATFSVFHLYLLLVVDLFIQPALQQTSFPHYQHLRFHIPGRVDVLLRRIGGRLVPRTLLVLILLLRSSIWWRLLLVMLMPLLLLPLLGYSQFCIFQNCQYLASALNID